MRGDAFVTAALAAVCSLSAAALHGQTADPIYANSFESGLIGFGPPLSLVPAPSSNIQTLDMPLQVTLSAPATGDTFVAIVSESPGVVSVDGGGATVPGGETTATVLVSGLLGAAAPVTLWATLGNTMGAAVRVEQALNETDAMAEADFCIVQYPQAFGVAPGALTQPVYGQLYEMNFTEAAGPPAGWSAQVGYGPQGSDPRLLAGWHFFDAGWNIQVDNNDEFQASFAAPASPGIYSYAYRFSNDGGGTFSYCDTDGAGSNGGLTFEPAMLGQMTVADP
jgi:hypothetical protein